MNCIYEKKIEPSSDDWKEEVLDGITGIKSKLEIVYNIQKSIISLVKLLGISDLEDPTSTIVAQQLFQIFLLPSDQMPNPRESIEKLLKTKIKTLGKENMISQDQMIHILKNIPKILNWLFQSNNWLLNSNYPLQLHHFFLDFAEFIDTLYTLFSKNEFDADITAIQTIVNEGFNEDIEEFLNLNAQSVSQFFAVRISELIEHVGFPDMMNDMLGKFLKHLKGIIAAHKTYEVQVDLLSASEIAVAKRTRTGKERTNQTKAESLIDLVKETGGYKKEDTSTEHYLKAKNIYLDKRFDDAFSNHPACHSIAAADMKVMDESVKLKHVDTYYAKLVNKLYPCLLPQQKLTLPSGLELEIDGIISLMDQIKLPDRWEQIRGLGEKMINQVIESGNFMHSVNFKTYSKTLGTILVIALLRDKMDTLLIKGLKDCIDSFCSPNLWEFLVATMVLPSQLESGFAGWTRSTMGRNINEISKFFHGMIDKTDDHFVFSKPNDSLLSYLYTLMKTQTIDFDFDKGGITPAKFKELIQPLIDEIINHLNKNLKKSKSLSFQVIEDQLKRYFEEETAPVNKVYGDLCTALLVDIANFGSKLTQFAVKMAKNLISEEASQSMHQFTKSYHSAVSSLVGVGSKTLLDKEVINKMVFPEEPMETTLKKLKPKTQKQFTTNLHHLSHLWHDGLYRKIKIDVKSDLLTGLATPSSKELETITTDIFKKIIHRPIINKSLMLQNIDIIASYFEKAAASCTVGSKKTNDLSKKNNKS